MKKVIKKALLAMALGAAIIGGITTINLATQNVYAKEDQEKKPLKIDLNKNENGFNVIVGTYQDDDKNTYDMYYSDGYFAKNANVYNPHMATLAAQLADASCTYVENGNYKQGDKHIKEALENIGFETFYTNDGYLKKPTTDSVGCIIAGKKLEKASNMKYDYVVDITIRSAGYEAEWASNVTLGDTGEAKGFADQVTKIIQIYLDNFLKDNKNINEALKSGKVAFYINGFSRGGAIANMTGKRIVDMYQEEGNGIYAYCIEAPQGGVKEEIIQNHDYRGIHNIINPNDLVCYVAPTEMGFMRYGVDHYIYGDEKEMIDDFGMYFNTPCDNLFNTLNYDVVRKKVVNELKTLFDKKDVKDYEPYEVTWKRFDLRHLTLRDDDGGKLPLNLIQKFIHNLVYRNGKIAVDRKTYVNKLQEPLRNVLAFIFKEPNFDKLIVITNLEPLVDAFKNVLATYISGAKVHAKDTDNPIVLAWRFATGDRDLIYTLDFNETQRAKIAREIKKVVGGQKFICDELDKYYPTKAKGALNDIYTIIDVGLRGGNNIDDYITFAENALGLLNNHKTKQVIAYLRIADDYFQQAKFIGGW